MPKSQIPSWVTNYIDLILQPKLGIATRYPYTYAYDFIRSHAEVFGLEGTPSRADVGQWLYDALGVDDSSPLHRAVCEALADAYLKEHNEVVRV